MRRKLFLALTVLALGLLLTACPSVPDDGGTGSGTVVQWQGQPPI